MRGLLDFDGNEYLVYFYNQTYMQQIADRQYNVSKQTEKIQKARRTVRHSTDKERDDNMQTGRRQQRDIYQTASSSQYTDNRQAYNRRKADKQAAERVGGQTQIRLQIAYIQQAQNKQTADSQTEIRQQTNRRHVAEKQKAHQQPTKCRNITDKRHGAADDVRQTSDKQNIDTSETDNVERADKVWTDKHTADIISQIYRHTAYS